MCPRPMGLLFQPGDSLWIPVTTRAGGGQPGGLAAWPGAGRSLPTVARSNFSPTLLRRSCVSPAYSLRTAASGVLPVTRSRCPTLGPIPARAPTPYRGLPILKLRSPMLGPAVSLAAGTSRAAVLGEAPPLSLLFPSLLASRTEPLERAAARNWQECPALPSPASGHFGLQINALSCTRRDNYKVLSTALDLGAVDGQ